MVSDWPIEAVARRSLAGVILNGRPPLRPRARAEASPAVVAFGDQLAFELGQRGEDPEYELAGGGGGVDRGALPGEHLQPDAAGGQVVDGVDQVVQVAAEPVESPDDEGVAVSERFET